MRLDAYLVERGLARSRATAKRAIEQGQVTVDGVVASRASAKVTGTEELSYSGAEDEWVSRGALKLLAGLDHFGIDPEGRHAVDIGASTGGFTQVLLSRNVASVVAVDVGREQLHPDVKGDPKVHDLSPRDARTLTALDFETPPDLLVCDASFIGLTKVLAAPLRLVAPRADILTLVKPQFEVGPEHVGRGGLVTMPEEDVRALIDRDVVPFFENAGFTVRGLIDSPILGGDGNREYLLHAARHG